MLIYRYLSITNDVLTSVRKMEESLKRLKRAKGSSASSGQGLSDDDKIRLQLFLDVQTFGKLVSIVMLQFYKFSLFKMFLTVTSMCYRLIS